MLSALNKTDSKFPRLQKLFPWFLTMDVDSLEKRRQIVATWLIWLAILVLTYYTLLAVMQENIYRIVLDMLATIALVLNLVFIHNSGLRTWNIMLILAIFGLLESTLYMFQGVDDFGYLWYFTFPGLAVYLLGSRNGGIASLLLLIPIVIVMISGERIDIFRTYDPQFEYSMLGGYIAICMTAYMFELIAERYRNEISKINRSLQTTVELRTHELAEKVGLAESALREKEILLKEVHHRTKNNMNVIASLLNLQRMYATKDNILEIFESVERRIHSMTRVHERLYKSKNIAVLDLGSYIMDLVQQLTESFTLSPEEIKIDSDLVPIELGLDQAIPLGLVINEILTNSFKHARQDGQQLTIRVALTELADGDISLLIGDNGPGMPAEQQTKRTLGTHLINILLEEQLQGKIEEQSDHGLTYRITFPSIEDCLSVPSHDLDITLIV